MSNIIPFEAGSVPDYIRTVSTDINNDLTAHASSGFPVISIKGKKWTVVRNGDKKILSNPKDPDSPATYIDVVMLKVNNKVSKVFYAKGYAEGEESTKPDCFSNMGDKPDAGSEKPQAKTCALCPHNQWGSRIGDNGGKGKACSDSVRMAISTPELINDPYLLRVPAASIKSLGEFGKILEKRGGKRLGYNMVVTRIGFDPEATAQKLTFKAIGFLDELSHNQAKVVADTETVASILGANFSFDIEAEEPLPEVSLPKAVPVVEKPKAEKPKAKPAPAPVVATEVDVPELDLSDLNFDD